MSTVVDESHTLVDIVKHQNPDGGQTSVVWDRYAKLNGSRIGRKGLSHASMIYNAFVKWYGSGRSLYDMNEADAMNYVEFLAKNTSPNSVWRVSLPTLADIWRFSLPLCTNHWSKFKWDSMRNIVVPETPSDNHVDENTGLEDFAERFFAAQASSGKKIERNSRGFIRHLMKHMGVAKVGDVTRRIAYEYAIKLRDDPKCRVVRAGTDRISKLAAMWNALLPNAENPFAGVSYADAIRVAKYNTLMEAKEDLSPTECLRALPPALWSQYCRKHAQCSVPRMRTLKAIFFRFWEKSGVERPIQVTTDVAYKYADEVCASKSTGLDDIRELRSAWSLLMPNITNPWDAALKRQLAKTEMVSAEAAVKEKPEIPNVEDAKVIKPEFVGERNDTKQEDAEKSYTFAQIFDNWKAATADKNYNPVTERGYLRYLTYLNDYCTERGIDKVSKYTINTDMARDFENAMSKRLTIPSNATRVMCRIWPYTFGMYNPWRAILTDFR